MFHFGSIHVVFREIVEGMDVVDSIKDVGSTLLRKPKCLVAILDCDELPKNDTSNEVGTMKDFSEILKFLF